MYSSALLVPLSRLGLLFISIGLITDGIYALAGGAIGSWLEEHPGLTEKRHVLSGVIYLGLGATAALSGSD